MPKTRRHLIEALATCLLSGVTPIAQLIAAPPQDTLVTHLQQQLGLNERQVRGALGALLVFAQERLSADDFAALAMRVPNAQQIMQDVKLEGIVTHPLDDLGAYESSLASLGIGQPLASQFAPAVVDYLGATGHDTERDILTSIIN